MANRQTRPPLPLTAEQPELSRDNEQRWFGRSVILLVSIISAFFLYGSLSLGIGNLGNPGPGLWPGLISAFTLTASSVSLFRRIPYEEVDGGRPAWAAWAICGLVAFGILLPLLGFILSSVLLGIYFASVVGRSSWWVALITSGMTAAGTYVLFAGYLNVQLAEGVFMGVGV